MPKEIREITKEMKAIYAQGFIRSLWIFAYWKNGIQLVGSCGKRLATALGEVPANVKQYCKHDIYEIVNKE